MAQTLHMHALHADKASCAKKSMAMLLQDLPRDKLVFWLPVDLGTHGSKAIIYLKCCSTLKSAASASTIQGANCSQATWCQCRPVLCQGVHGRLERRCALLLAWLRLHRSNVGLCGSSCERQVFDNTYTDTPLNKMLRNLVI